MGGWNLMTGYMWETKSLFQQESCLALRPGTDGCKARRAGHGYSMSKRRNAADAVPGLNPEGRWCAGALPRCGQLVWNDQTAPPAPCTASRTPAARGMSPTEIGS